MPRRCSSFLLALALGIRIRIAAGVAWVVDGQACVARAPGYRVTCPKLPPASDVAWQGETAWALLPGPGLAVTLDLAPGLTIDGTGTPPMSETMPTRDHSPSRQARSKAPKV